MGGSQNGMSNVKLSFGIGVSFFSVFLFISLISYVIHCDEDQIVIESLRTTGVMYSDNVKNVCGIIGAKISYFLMYKCIGISSLIIVFALLLLGLRIMNGGRLGSINVMKTISLSLLLTFIVNIVIGYLCIKLNFLQNTKMMFVAGVMTITIGTLCDKLFGYGTVLLEVVLISIFYIFTIRRNIFSIIWLKAKSVLSVFDIRRFFRFRLRKKKNIINNRPFENDDRYNSETVEKYQDSKKQLDNSGNKDFELSYEDRGINNDDNIKPEVLLKYSSESTTGLVHTDTQVSNLEQYRYPHVGLLIDYHDNSKGVSKEELKSNEAKIISTLNDFRIGISSINATIGPTVTLYEIVPQAGIKISRIKNLENDIALSLSALGIRIIAPMPGRGTIGIEVPNKHRSMVSFKEMLESNKFSNSKMELPIILGKGVSHDAYVVDLTKMPHMLIAGATGQGKSVGLNTMLMSLIFKKHPSQLKLVLIDPKKVELSLYSCLQNHFLARLSNSKESIITETRKVIDVLSSLCAEMDHRYDLLKMAGIRNIKEYNELILKGDLSEEEGHHYLPYIVLVIDEFADLMMTAGKEVEMPIARLAQLARAIGIHLILATQRPSVNVITGIIKANFPVRISFRVTSKIDSRTILDASGAEQLIGQGDMLVSINSEIIRLQCPFLSTSEINKVCEFIGEQSGYDSSFSLPKPEFRGDNDSDNGYECNDCDSYNSYDSSERDPLFEEAARMIVIQQQGSTSYLQRRLKLGYNRAGRLMDQLERVGIVGPFDGKNRPVLISTEDELQKILNSKVILVLLVIVF